MPPIAKAKIPTWKTPAADGDPAIAAQLSDAAPTVTQASQWDTDKQMRAPINIATGRATMSAATAAAAAYDPHVQQPMEVVVASSQNPVIGAYAGQRHAAYAGTPFATTPGYTVPSPFDDDVARRFFKMPSSTAPEQLAVLAQHTAIQSTVTAAIVSSVIGPALTFAAHAKARDDYYQQHRAHHHAARSAARTQGFYGAVDQHLVHFTVTRSIGTEMRGEVATVESLISGLGYQLKMAFDGKGHTGIDQIWVRRVNGDITEYLIVEAKGSHNAHLGDSSKGKQMSPRWVYMSLMEMVKAGTHAQTARKILAAIHGVSNIRVAGRMIKCKFKPSLPSTAKDQKTIIDHSYEDYNIQWV